MSSARPVWCGTPSCQPGGRCGSCPCLCVCEADKLCADPELPVVRMERPTLQDFKDARRVA